jgi:hypothetical protein
MNILSAAELLNVWERGLGRSHFQKALILLATSCSDLSPGYLAELSIGQRDYLLLMLRKLTFGPSVIGLTNCSECGEALELKFDLSEILIRPKAKQERTFSYCCAGYEVIFRLPNSLDLAAIDGSDDLDYAKAILLQRCILEVRHEGVELSSSMLPPVLAEAVAERMEKIDPQADILISASCTSCSHQWSVIFDIVSFLWSEIDAWARRLMVEVHTLARAYGWSEEKILAMSPFRRQFYLEMVGE